MKVKLNIIDHFPLPDTSAGRSIGVHVSDIIRCQAMESGILALEDLADLSLIPLRDINNLPIGTLLRIHFGLAWERYYIPLLENLQDHPGEKHVDGIYMSPDAFELTSFVLGKKNVYYTHVHEIKCTSKSINTVRYLDNVGKKSSFMWLAQIKAYCHAAKSTRATLHVLFVYGNYRRPFDPILTTYDIEFTEQEILDNWQSLTEYRDYRLDYEANKHLYPAVNFGEWSGEE